MNHRFLFIGAGPQGEWVFSSHQGSAVIISNNPGGPFSFTYSSTPNTSLFEQSDTIGEGEFATTAVSQIRSVDFSFGRYLVVTDPVRLTLDFAYTPTGPYETYVGTGASNNIFPILRPRLVTPPEPPPGSTPEDVIANLIAGFTSPNQIITDTVAKVAAGDFILTPQYVPTAGLTTPWNRAYILDNFQDPVFGTNVFLGGSLSVFGDNFEAITGAIGVTLTGSDFEDLTTPGLYLLVGSLGASLFTRISDTATTEPFGSPQNIIRAANSTTTLTIGPIP